ncbi:MAG: AbrB/MazE/SpoVT family DNA-binding domain-containing protein [Pyrinomonadaceae bacterium]
METVTLSSKYQIVIPRIIRERLGLSPGERFRVISFGDRVELIPLRPIEEMKGILKGRGIKPNIVREDDRI